MAQITVKGKNALDERTRTKALQIIADNSDTDVLEILSKAASKPNANDKVRRYKHFL